VHGEREVVGEISCEVGSTVSGWVEYAVEVGVRGRPER
jgi:hypothetical protein